MRTYHLYDATTGEFTGQSLSSNKPDPTSFIELNTPVSLRAIEFSGDIRNYKVNIDTGLIEQKADVHMSVTEIKQQLNTMREQYFATRDEALLAQMETLRNMLQTG